MNNFLGRVFFYFHISSKGTSGTTWARFCGSKQPQFGNVSPTCFGSPILRPMTAMGERWLPLGPLGPLPHLIYIYIYIYVYIKWGKGPGGPSGNHPSPMAATGLRIGLPKHAGETFPKWGVLDPQNRARVVPEVPLLDIWKYKNTLPKKSFMQKISNEAVNRQIGGPLQKCRFEWHLL